MTLTEQATIVVEAMKHDLIVPQDVIDWAEQSIAVMDRNTVPSPWLVDLAVLRSPYVIDYICIAREHAAGGVTPEQHVQMLILSHHTCSRPIEDSLSRLFQFFTSKSAGNELSPVCSRIMDALIEWDSQEDMSIISPELRARFDALFAEVNAGAEEIASLIPSWKVTQALIAAQ